MTEEEATDTLSTTLDGSASGQLVADSAARVGDAALRSSLWAITSLVINLPLGFLVNALLARILLPEGYGILTAALFAITLTTNFSDFGCRISALQFATAAEATGDHASTLTLLGRVQSFTLLVQVPLLGVVSYALLSSGGTVIGVLAIALVGCAQMLSASGNLWEYRNRRDIISKVGLFGGSFSNLLTIYCAWRFHTPESVILSRVGSPILASLVLAVLLPTADRRALWRLRMPSRWPTGYWSFGVLGWISSLIGVIVFSRSEVFVLQAYSQADAAGLFALAYGLAQQFTSPLGVISSVILGAITATMAASPRGVERLILDSSSGLSFFLGALMCIASAVVPGFSLIFGSEFDAAVWLLLPLVLGSGIQALGYPYQSFAFASRSAKVLLSSNLMAMILDIGLVVALAPTLGVWGAVCANLTAQLASLAYVFRYTNGKMETSAVSILKSVTSFFVGWIIFALTILLRGSLPSLSPILLILVSILFPIVSLGIWISLIRLLDCAPQMELVNSVLRRLPTFTRPASSLLLNILGK